jgi:hypothetical protein
VLKFKEVALFIHVFLMGTAAVAPARSGLVSCQEQNGLTGERRDYHRPIPATGGKSGDMIATKRAMVQTALSIK